MLYSSQHITPDQRISSVDSLDKLVSASDIIIPAVPIHEWENVLKQIAPFTRQETIILDILSVKEYSVHILQKYFSHHQCIATHPMFGPTSIKKNNDTIHGFTIVFCPTERLGIYDDLIAYCNGLGLMVKEMSPKEHDRYAAYSQFFSLVVRGIGKKLGIKPTPIDTPGAIAMLELLTYDFDEKIVQDMLVYNTYCSEVLDITQTVVKNLQDKQ